MNHHDQSSNTTGKTIFPHPSATEVPDESLDPDALRDIVCIKTMTITEFTMLVEKTPAGVVLLEGRRSIPDADAAHARALGRYLAMSFPRLRFRSGNAEGSDQAFAEGVAAVDACRLQVIAPYSTHRKAFRYADATYDSPESLALGHEAEIVYKTAQATPKNKSILDKRNQKSALGAKAAYLIRDTMKVLGHSVEFPKPIFALFYVDLTNTFAGGTGHTIRVCQQEGVPFAFQDSWTKWPQT